jgi:hypothetical protein
VSLFGRVETVQDNGLRRPPSIAVIFFEVFAMFKLIVFGLGLVIGASSGAWYGIHHPAEAESHLAAERNVIQSAENKIQASLSPSEAQAMQDQIQAMRDKIKQLASKGSGGIAGTDIGSNLVGGSAPTVDPDIQALDAKAQSQLDMLKAKLGN